MVFQHRASDLFKIRYFPARTPFPVLGHIYGEAISVRRVAATHVRLRRSLVGE